MMYVFELATGKMFYFWDYLRPSMTCTIMFVLREVVPGHLTANSAIEILAML